MSRMRKASGRLSGLDVVERLAGLVARRGRLMIGIWVVLVLVLSFLGRDLESKLVSQPFYVDGTQTKRAHEIAEREFGADLSMIVMLRGPHAAVERQGKRLVKRLEAMPQTLVASPWSRGEGLAGLSPSPGVAALIVRTDARRLEDLLPSVREAIDAEVRDPVSTDLAGFPVIVDSIVSASKHASAIGELIAVPVLMIVLLFIFRSVIAAFVPLVIGGGVVGATRGVLDLLLHFLQLELFAAALLAMMGLALGVDYSLLVVSRFREEYGGGDTAEAVRRTIPAASRSILPAASGLVLAMLAAIAILPNGAVISVAVAVIAVTVVSAASAICVTPAVLGVLGERLDRWSLPAREGPQLASLRWARRIAARPGIVVAMMVLLLVCAGLALSLKSNLASIALLPSGDPGRTEQEAVEEELGPGWLAPMEIVIDGRGKPVTSPRRLRALADFQHRVERDPGVSEMVGFAGVQKGAEQMYGVEDELAAQERGLEKLQVGISKLHAGSSKGSVGLRAAAGGSGELDSAVGVAGAGAGVLAHALQRTSAGSARLADGLGRADGGSGKLAEGAAKASTGAGKLAEALGKAKRSTGEISGSADLVAAAMRSGEARLEETRSPLQSTEQQLAAAWQALQRMAAGRSDPEYAAALAAVEEANRQLTGNEMGSGEPSDASSGGVAGGIERADGEFGVGSYLATRMKKNGKKASEGMSKLSGAAEKLAGGLEKLGEGSRRLSDGIAALAHGGEVLSPAMEKIGAGAARLADGLGQLKTGTGQLAAGLVDGAQKSKLLSGGLGKIEKGLERQGGGEGDESQLAQLQKNSPNLFHSPYFVLAGLDGSRPGRRQQLGSLISLNHGGMDGRMLVIPSDEPSSSAAAATKDRLEADGAALARQTDAEVAVGGTAPLTIEANRALRDEAPYLRIALSLVSLLILIPVMRSLLVPLFAALINLVTVSASFGLLALLFNGSFLGGPGFVDGTVIPTGMIVVFGLAIDYEVFVFARIREEYVRTGSTSTAVRNGLDRTAHVVTGAALIMIAAFLSFSVSEFMTLRNFGVMQAIAVAIDAFIVRLIFVPAIMGWLGARSWWMPSWLDRLLPGKSRAAVESGR